MPSVGLPRLFLLECERLLDGRLWPSRERSVRDGFWQLVSVRLGPPDGELEERTNQLVTPRPLLLQHSLRTLGAPDRSVTGHHRHAAAIYQHKAGCQNLPRMGTLSPATRHAHTPAACRWVKSLVIRTCYASCGLKGTPFFGPKGTEAKVVFASWVWG